MKQPKFKSRSISAAKLLGALFLAVLTISSCKKESSNQIKYYEVGVTNQVVDWRDSSFIVATSNEQLIKQVEEQLTLPISERKILSGALVSGSGGYNKNRSFTFNWHLKETDWQLTDISIEISDGRPYSDVHQNPAYWLDTVKRYAPWNSYIKKGLN